MVNNYIAIDINGKKIGLKFAFPQTKAFAVSMVDNIDIFFDGDNLSPIGIAKLIQTAHKNDCLIKEVAASTTLEEISNWVDDAAGNEARIKVLTDVVNVWQESEYTKSWMEQLKKKTAEILNPTSKPPKKSRSSTSKLKPLSGRRATVRKK